MALTSYKILTAATAAALAALVADEIADGNSPVGAPSPFLAKEYPAKWDMSQAIAVGVDTVTDYKVVQAGSAADLAERVTDAIGDGFVLLGGLMVLQPPTSVARGHAQYAQAMYKGAPADAGMGAGGGGGGSVAIDDVTGLTAALAAKADLTAGTVPIAQLPVATNAAKDIASFGSGMTVTAGAVTVP